MNKFNSPKILLSWPNNIGYLRVILLEGSLTIYNGTVCTYIYALAQCTWCGCTITFRFPDDYMYVFMYVAMYSMLVFS